MLRSELLYSKLKEIQALARAVNAGEAFRKAFDAETVEDGFEALLSTLDEARTEVENCVFSKPEKQTRFLGEMTAFRSKLLSILFTRDRNAKGALFNEGALERIGAIADSVGERIEHPVGDLDRASFAGKTLELIEQVRQWELESYSSRSLLLSLGMIVQISQSEGVSTSDTEIRRRVKNIVASFAVEYAIMDREFETKWETLKRWAKSAYSGSSTPLGLTADVATVAGLLPKP